MKRILLLVFALSLFIPAVSAQTSANSYYRKMHNEQKKLMKKQIRFMKMLLLNEDIRRLDQSRDQIVGQIETSQKAIKNQRGFNGDDAYVKDYLNVMSEYLKAYTDLYDKAKESSGEGITTYEQMEVYLKAFEEMEIEIITADESVMAIEEYFANKHNLEMIDDGEVAEMYNNLMYLSEYLREIRLIFSRTIFEADNIEKAFSSRDFDALPRLRVAFTKACDFSMSDLVKLGDFDGNDDLYKNTMNLLEDMRKMGEDDMMEAMDYLQDADWNEKAEAKGSKILLAVFEDINAAKEENQANLEHFVYDYIPE